MEDKPVTWRKSTRSGDNGGGCVEVATTPEQVMVRDSKDRSGPVLIVPPAAWRSFLATLNR